MQKEGETKKLSRIREDEGDKWMTLNVDLDSILEQKMDSSRKTNKIQIKSEVVVKGDVSSWLLSFDKSTVVM